VTVGELAVLNRSIVGRKGHPNVRPMCLTYPYYENMVQQCVLNNDLKKNAELTFQSQLSRKQDTVDAIYCQLGGLCEDSKVTENSTKDDAEKICNERFQSQWKRMGWRTYVETVAESSGILAKSGSAIKNGQTTWAKVAYYAKKSAVASAMTSCAMGTYHCEVFYCKQNFCGKGKYAAWSNISWDSKTEPKLPTPP